MYFVYVQHIQISRSENKKAHISLEELDIHFVSLGVPKCIVTWNQFSFPLSLHTHTHTHTHAHTLLQLKLSEHGKVARHSCYLLEMIKQRVDAQWLRIQAEASDGNEFLNGFECLFPSSDYQILSAHFLQKKQEFSGVAEFPSKL